MLRHRLSYPVQGSELVSALGLIGQNSIPISDASSWRRDNGFLWNSVYVRVDVKMTMPGFYGRLDVHKRHFSNAFPVYNLSPVRWILRIPK